MKYLFLAFFLFANFCYAQTDIYSFTAKGIDGEEVSLSSFKNKLILITNFSSKCGTTAQLGDFEELYQQYKDKDFLILGFPSEDFAPMDTKTGEEIKSFCSKTYGVTFPLFAKINVTGNKIHPLFSYLTQHAEDAYNGGVAFNAEKFLVNKKGHVIKRYGAFTGPLSARLKRDIEKELAS